MGISVVIFNGLTDPATLEAWDCNEGLTLAQDLNIRNVQITSDCQEVVLNIANGCPCKYTTAVKDIKARQALVQQAVFKFEGRKFNFEAHKLAKASSFLGVGRHVWLSTLPDFVTFPDHILS